MRPHILITSFIILFSMNFPVFADEFGEFSGLPSVEFRPDGRTIRLQEEFWFRDDQARQWTVPIGYDANGASIPRPLWRLVGPPLVGKYRDASIIHDYFTEIKKHDWREVHKLFYLGMRARGVESKRAWFMYKAVEWFGPRWEKVIEIPQHCKAGPKFDPERCVLNTKPKLVETTVPFNATTLEKFSSELKNQGFDDEIAILKEELQ